jgi:hypothetical protein
MLIKIRNSFIPVRVTSLKKKTKNKKTSNRIVKFVEKQKLMFW